MKKLFFFAAMLATTVAFANTEVVLVNVEGYPTETEVKGGTSPKAVEAGTILGTGTNIVLKQAFAGEMQAVGMNANAYTQFVKGTDTEPLNAADAMGLQEKNTNPKDATSTNVSATNLVVPTQGGVLQIEAAADGYVYVLHKASSNKQYFAWEIYNNIATAYAYEFGMVTCPFGKSFNSNKCAGAFGEGVTPTASELVTDSIIKFSVVGDEDGYLEDGSQNIFPEFYVYVTEGAYADSLANNAKVRKDGAYAQNGLGVIAIKVQANTTYYVHAGGSKISTLGAIFTDEKLPVYAYNGTNKVELFAGFEPEGTAVENVEASELVIKTIENGMIVIEKNGRKYNALGAQL